MKVFILACIVPLLDGVGFENVARGREVKERRGRKIALFLFF